MTADSTVTVALQSSITTDVTLAVAVVAGLALLAGVLSAVVAVIYRWYVRERVPIGLPILVGLSGVALSLNTSRALGQVINETGQPIDETAALFNVIAVLVSAATARAAVDVGDRIGTDVFVATGGREVQADVSRMVRAVGRVITVEIPEDIDDIVGYDPVPDETKAKLGGRTFVFPRRLTVDELRQRLVTRLKADYAVGHVDVDLTEEGTVDYIALGSRAAGIGPTLPPETSAVAVRADPGFSAGAGDLVQVWRVDPLERVLTAEVRGSVDDIVTLAVDAADTRRLEDDTQYKLVTLPVEQRADREFASLFRSADETMAAVRVATGSTLAGQSLGATDVTVVAVRTEQGSIEPLPQRDRRLEGGETLYVVATPEAIRRVEAAAAASDPADPDVGTGATIPPEHRVDPGTPVADRTDGTPAADSPTDAQGTASDDAETGDGTPVDTDPTTGDESRPDAGATGVDRTGEERTDRDGESADEWGLPGEIATGTDTADAVDGTDDKPEDGSVESGDDEGDVTLSDETSDDPGDATDDTSGDAGTASGDGTGDSEGEDAVADLAGTDADDLLGTDEGEAGTESDEREAGTESDEGEAGGERDEESAAESDDSNGNAGAGRDGS